MTSDEVLDLYDKAIRIDSNADHSLGELDPIIFARLVEATVRERCAALCESYGMPDGTSETARILAAAIRRMK